VFVGVVVVFTDPVPDPAPVPVAEPVPLAIMKIIKVKIYYYL